MKGNKIICEYCGAAVEESLLAKNLLNPPSSETEPATRSPWEKVVCPYCGFEYKALPYTIEEICEVDPHCHNCGKVLDENDNIFVLHTHEDAKPAVYEWVGNSESDKLYRKVKEAEPEKDHKYFFCSQDCYLDYLKKFGFNFKGGFVRKEA